MSDRLEVKEGDVVRTLRDVILGFTLAPPRNRTIATGEIGFVTLAPYGFNIRFLWGGIAPFNFLPADLFEKVEADNV
jgi:hypothetical protein